jgi:hypothetical protein
VKDIRSMEKDNETLLKENDELKKENEELKNQLETGKKGDGDDFDSQVKSLILQRIRTTIQDPSAMKTSYTKSDGKRAYVRADVMAEE